MRYPIIKPEISFDEVDDDLRRILESGRLTAGPYIEQFENLVADVVGAPHAIAVTSATTAMQLALAASDIGPGDEVLVSDFTYPATVNAVHWAGARPVLVDCLAGRFDVDVSDAEKKLTEQSRAIIVVDPFGQPAELAAVRSLATRHGLILIEDAACALGASRDGKNCGNWQDFGCFSFHPRKIVTTGEGGIVTCQSDDIACRLRLLRSHGAVMGENGTHFHEPGFNFRMSEIQAALGLPQLTRLDEVISRRRDIAKYYIEALADLSEVSVPLSADLNACTFQSFVVLLDPIFDRDIIIKALAQEGIETTLGTYAAHSQPAFSAYGYAPGDLPNSWQNQKTSLTLPLPNWLTKSDVDKIIGVLSRTLKMCRRG